MSWRLEFDRDGERLPVEAQGSGTRIQVHVGAKAHEVTLLSAVGDTVRFVLAGRVHQAQAVQTATEVQVRLDGHTWRLPLHGGRTRGAAGAGDGRIVAPMSGTVQEIKVAVGDTVSADQTVAVVTAMKMEHKLAAGLDGTVVEVGPDAGSTVDQGTLLVRIEPHEGPGSER